MNNAKEEQAPEIQFRYHKTMPNCPEYRVNIQALRFYGLYRNTVFDSYKENPQLADDIRAFPKVYTEPEKSGYKNDPYYTNPLYHYSVFACADAMKEWALNDTKMQAYIAYRTDEHKQEAVGFIHFNESKVAGQPVVYIAQAGVAERGVGLGRRLMECVLKHYPEGTTFYVLTREFNSQAKTLYGDRFKFTPISFDEIQTLGFDKRYCGFKHTTTSEELNAIPSPA